LTETPIETPEGQRLVRSGEAMLSRGMFRARMAILWERLWPALASIATVVGLFLAVSWLGLWLWLPPIGRAIGLAVFFLLAVAGTLPLLQVRWPSKFDALRRLDRFSRTPDRPATAIADKMADGFKQGYVEGSGANPMMELTKLIAASRAFDGTNSMIEGTESSLQNAIRTLGEPGK